MANRIYKITEDFEKALCDYTGAPYAIALDNMSNALFLALYYEKHITHFHTPILGKKIFSLFCRFCLVYLKFPQPKEIYLPRFVFMFINELFNFIYCEKA